MARSTAPTIPAPPERRLRSIEQVAEYLGVSQRAVREWIGSGILTAYRVGPRLLRLDQNEVDALVVPVDRNEVSR